jgi:hypothetical protein
MVATGDPGHGSGLVELLAGDLLRWMEGPTDGVPRRVLLWLDPERQFARLVPHLDTVLAARSARLLRHDAGGATGQFALKLALLEMEGDADADDTPARAVVYLPGYGRTALEPSTDPDDGVPPLWGLYEYRYKGCVWGLGKAAEPGVVPDPPPLLRWLRGHGLAVVDAATGRKLAAGGADALLARYAVARRDLPPAAWPRPLRLSDVTTALGGDPRDALRGLLVAPANEVRQWDAERELRLARIAEDYGFAFPLAVGDPEALASHAAAVLALAEAWDAFGRPDDFPYRELLPTSMEQRERAVRFLRDDVLSHVDLRPRFFARMERVEQAYDLVPWAEEREGQPAGMPLLARARWGAVMRRFEAANAEHGWRAACEVLARDEALLAAAAAGSLDGAGLGTHWAVLRDLLRLATSGDAASEEAQGLNRARDLVAAYAARWWRCDRLHLRIRAACARAPRLEAVRRVADLAYLLAYLAPVNDRFAALVDVEGAWPPRDVRPVDAARETLWDADGQRHAVVICDALRWDLAEELREGLPEGDCTLTPLASTLPSKTPFGMTALLPLGATPLTVEYKGTTLSIKQGASPELTARQGRKDYLTAALAHFSGKGAKAVGFVDLSALLAGAAVPRAAVVIVFDTSIDEQGENATESLPVLAESFVANVRRGVERLHGAGIATVHVVTDHGFLLVPPDGVDALGSPQVPPAQAVHKEARWAALKRGAVAADVMRFALPLAPDGYALGFPRGVRTLEKATAYMHGGISLQECVIPHLVSFAPLPRVRLGLDLAVESASITVGAVAVTLRPVLPPNGSLGGAHPRTVRLTLTAGGREVGLPHDAPLRADIAVTRTTLYLRPGSGLRAGTPLRLEAIDAETGEELGALDLRLINEWD